MDVYIVKGDGGVFETGLIQLFDLFKFVIKVDGRKTYIVHCPRVCSGVLHVTCLTTEFLNNGLLIFDSLAEPLAQIPGLSMRFSSIYRLDDKVQIFFQGKLTGSKFFRIVLGMHYLAHQV